MATGSASRNSTTSESSLDLAFLNLSTDCETWLTGPDEGQNLSESISTQEWLDGALKNSQYDHTKLHRIMQSQKKQRKKLIHDLPSHPSSLLTSVTEELDKTSSTSDNSFLAPDVDNDSDGEEFFDASTNFEEVAELNKSISALNNQNIASAIKASPRQPLISPRNANTNISNTKQYKSPNIPNVQRSPNISTLQGSPRRISDSSEKNISNVSPRILNNTPKQLSPQVINGPKVSPRRENSVPNDKISPKPTTTSGSSKIPAVTTYSNKSGIRPPIASSNSISRHHQPNISPKAINTESKTSVINDNNIGDTSFLDLSRKIEEQEKRLLEEALQGKKHESRPSSSASTNSEMVKEDSGTTSAANIPTSKSVDFKGVLRLSAVGRSTSTRIPMYGRTASVASTLHRIPKPRPNIVHKVLPPPSPKEPSNDPWGDNCF